jgi:hypothetical protein
MAVDREAVRAWLERTCSEQAVPVWVSDAVVIAQVGVLLRRAAPPGGGSRQGAEPGGVPLRDAKSE